MKQCWICQAAILITIGCLIGFWHSNYHSQRLMIIKHVHEEITEKTDKPPANNEDTDPDNPKNTDEIKSPNNNNEDKPVENDQSQVPDYNSWPEMITIEQAYKAFTNKTYIDEYNAVMDIIFIDARSPEDYAQGHITGAYNITDKMFMRNELPEEMQYNWVENQLIIIYCTGGGCDVSHQLKIRMENYPFTNLHIIDEGFDGWEYAQYPITTGSQRQ